MDMFSQQYEIFKNKAFRTYFFSCMLAMFGNGLTYIIMVWVLMQFNSNIGSTVILMTCFWLPNVLLSPFFGVLADRISRKRLLLISNGLRASLLFIFAFASQYYLSPLSIYFLAIFVGCILAAYIPAAMTFIREIMPAEQMLYANSLVDIAYEMGAVLGMGGAGLILALTSVPACFAINGICYLLAMFLIKSISYKKNEDITKEKERFFVQLSQGWSYLRTRFILVMIYLVQALFFIAYMTVPVLLAPFAKSILHADVMQFGILEATLSVGIILGGFLSPYFASRYGIQSVILSLTGLGIAAFYLFSHSIDIHWAYFFHFLLGLSLSVWALLITLAQEMTALNYQGRVQSLFNSFSGIMILAFYYLLAHWQNLPLKMLYRAELILLTMAGFIMIIMLFKSQSMNTSALESN
ncbi:MFS transporter [Legionella israelensis]|uniref:MFS transporter n=2 Tax=Legionella israelensis TaxID=454 RepID=A0AAX1EFK2_9GAMM|nr:MFS transporter [Legionella israelensis]QBR83906.1 MFS transporter [Legionella israelensis]QBS10789.1 MFS transporter [Legionella israelensis]